MTNTRLDAGKGEEPARAVPVPSDAPAPDWSALSGYGQPSKVWDYRDAEGQCSFLVARWEMPGSGNGAKPGKVIRPVAWNGANWTLKAMPEDRPLYRLPELLEADPETQVIVVEGEKCADAVVKAFPGKVVTTWEGGAQAWRKTDFSPLHCRRVLLVADADDPGRMAMRHLGAHLLKHGARVRIVQPPGDDGADIADEIEQGGAKQASAWLKALAADFKPEKHEDAPKGEASSDDDWQSNLLSRAKTEPGVLFEDDAIKKLVALRNGNRSAWINLRSGIKDEREIDVPIGELDKATARTSTDYAGGAGLQGQALKWPAAEPSHEPVHGPELLCTISAMIRRYVDMPEALAEAVALWVIHTWLHPRLEISTFLNVTSATKRCGKSLLMEVAGALVYRPLLVSGRITPPALFRIIESAAPTLMLDEADTYIGENPELRGVVNGSQRLKFAWVIRCEGDDHEPRAFNTWCPKAISGIGGLPDTVLDRSLVIRLERRAEQGPQLSRWRDRDKGDLADLCGRIARWVQDNADAVLAARKGVAFPPNPNDRFRDTWEALLAIADTAGGEWAGTGGRAWRACRAIGADTNDETGAREMLLADLQVVFADRGNPNALPTKVILEALHGMEDCPWSEWKRGKPLSPHGLSALLKPFRITPSTIRLQDGTTPKGYKRTALEPHWKRYAEIASSRSCF